MERIDKRGESVELLDLSADLTELHDVEHYDDPPGDSQTARLRSRIGSATSVVLASPVYHGTFSGLLKSALDHLDNGVLVEKPVGIVAVGGGPRSAAVACDHLRTVARALGGWSAPTHVAVTGADYESSSTYDTVIERVDELIDELLFFRSM